MSPIYRGEDKKWYFDGYDKIQGPFETEEDAWKAYNKHFDVGG